MEPIRLSCPHCGSGLKAPGHLAGKQLQCPKCSQPIVVPGGEVAISAKVVESAEQPAPAQQTPTQQTPTQQTPTQAAAAASLDPLAVMPSAPTSGPADDQLCPHCHATIPSAASKCRHCGEFVKKPAASKQAVGEDTEKLHFFDYVVAIVLSPIGLLVGLLWLIRGYRKSYLMLAISGPLAVLLVGGTLLAALYWDENWFGPDYETQATSDLPFNSTPYVEPDPDDPAQQRPEVERVEPAIMRPPSEADLQQQRPEIQRAMRANVRLMLRDESGLGSGVIVRRDKDEVLILTNRHVIDANFSLSNGRPGTPLKRLPPVEVMFVTGDQSEGRIIWVGDRSVDLALVRAECPEERIEVADCVGTVEATPGEDCFAVGNPAGLGWTLTTGTISALRHHKVGAIELPIIQTDAAISPGNSGGGLYNGKGQLIGINNFIINPALASSVGFSIRYSFLFEIDPDELDALTN